MIFFFAFVFLFSDSVCLVSVLMGATNVEFKRGVFGVKSGPIRVSKSVAVFFSVF